MSDEIAIIFLRHGRSGGDDEQVHEGRYDAVLTEIGQAQAQARARDWQARSIHFDAIIASPLLRAHTTATIISQALNVPVEPDPDWMEVDNGPLAGLPYAVADERYPRPAFHNPYELLHGQGESDWELQCRAIRATERVVRRGPGRYLVVAHGAILNAAVRGILGTPPLVNWLHGVVFAFGDTGYLTTTYRPNQHRWIIKELHPGLPEDFSV